jgi:type II secretory pathway component PulM
MSKIALPVFARRMLQSWGLLSPRERSLLGLAALVVGALLIYFLTDWMLVQRSRLQRELPHAEARMRQMQDAVEELARLRAQPLPGRLSGTALTQALQALAEARGLSLSMQHIGDRVEIAGVAGFDSFVEWLAAVQAKFGLRCILLEIKTENGAQVIKASLATPADS